VCDEWMHTSAGAILESFFNDYLKVQRGLRPNSITSYADGMRLLLQFAAATGKKKVTQLDLDDLNADLVCQFLNSLEDGRSNAAQSRNQRLAALRTFFEYIGQRFPERLGQAQKVTAIPRKRAQPSETIFLERDEIEGTLAALPADGRCALRDRVLLVFLYNTGARVQEAADLRASDVHFTPTPRVHLHGKGDKWRVCPLWEETSSLLKKLLSEHMVLFPGYIARMHVAQKDPLLARHQTRAHFSIGQVALFGATENEGAGIARVVDDLPRTTVQQLRPDELALVCTATQSPREQELLRMELLDHGQTGPGPLKGLEEQASVWVASVSCSALKCRDWRATPPIGIGCLSCAPSPTRSSSMRMGCTIRRTSTIACYRGLHLGVRIEDDMILRVMHKADGHHLLEFPAAGAAQVPPRSRAFSTCNSASLMVPFRPNRTSVTKR
jgi:site-specific recombinase XerD